MNLRYIHHKLKTMEVVHSLPGTLLVTFTQAYLQVSSLDLVLVTPWYIIANLVTQTCLVGGWTNPFKKNMLVKMGSSSGVKIKKYLKPPANLLIQGTLQPDFAFSSFSVDSSTAPAPEVKFNSCWAKLKRFDVGLMFHVSYCVHPRSLT